MSFAIFNDEGCLENGFESPEAAQATIAKEHADDPHAHVGEECHDHPEHEAFYCELCMCEADEEGYAEETDE